MGCLALVIGFKSSTNLAAAYGVAVTGTMLITTLLFHTVTRDLWEWPAPRAWALTSLLLVVDGAFFAANLVKIEQGGWFPLVVAFGIYTLMTTWYRGRARLAAIVRENTLPMDLFLADVGRRRPPRVPGTAVFLTSDATGAPPVLLHHLKHNKVLHEKVMLMSVVTEEIPQVDEDQRVACKELGEGFYQVIAHYGFMETPDVPAVLAALGQAGENGKPVSVKVMETSFYLGRETLIAMRAGAKTTAAGDGSGLGRMSLWRKKLFILMTRNARSATAFFGLPPNRVVELGAQIQF
jgi:KUP system potassium uptake protein